MKKLLPVFFMLSAVGCMTACSEEQEIEKGNTDESIVNLTVHVKQVDKVSGSNESGYKLEGVVDKGFAKLNTFFEDRFIEVSTGPEKQEKGLRVNDLLLEVLNKDQAALDEYLKDYVCEFQSNEDGMIPSVKSPDRCPALPCSNLKHTYFNVENGRVFYDMDASNYKKDTNTVEGCYQVGMKTDGSEGTNPLTNEKYQASVLIYKASTVESGKQTEQGQGNTDIQSYKIKVTIDGGTPIEVDIADLKDKVSDNKLLISEIIKKAKSDIDLSKFNCDYAASDGFKASKRDDCKNAACTNAEKMFFDIAKINEHNVSSDGLASCFDVKTLSDIIVTTISAE